MYRTVIHGLIYKQMTAVWYNNAELIVPKDTNAEVIFYEKSHNLYFSTIERKRALPVHIYQFYILDF